ncbi:MAG: hypothetical protein ACI841_000679 [Planctomycetota bacterium]|jgi:hypothetical protein
MASQRYFRRIEAELTFVLTLSRLLRSRAIGPDPSADIATCRIASVIPTPVLMNTTKTALVLLAIPALSYASPIQNDARTRAMGGAGVASSDYLSALFGNPALLTNFDEDDDWGLMLPSIGVFASDPDNMIENTDDFVDAFEDLEDEFDNLTDVDGNIDLTGITLDDINRIDADLNNLADLLGGLNGRVLQFGFDTGIGFASPSDGLSWGIFAETHVSALAFVSVDSDDTDALRDAISDDGSGNATGFPDELMSDARVAAGGVGEFGIALAQSVDIGGFEVALGVRPKVQQVQTFNYVVEASQFSEDDSEDDFNAEDNRNEDEGFNVDVGAAATFNDSISAGFMIRNLIPREVESTVDRGRDFTYLISPRATAGVAWDAGAVTLTADVDLNKTKEFKELAIPRSRFIGVGAEMAGSWAQLRAGYRTDTENVYEDVLTGGIGLSPWDVFHLDITGQLGDETYGAVVQLSWTF